MRISHFCAEELSELMNHADRPLVSLLLPTHAAGKDKREDPIRFKNLTAAAETELERKLLKPPAVDRLLAPARDLLENRSFWNRGSGSVAMFLAPGFSRLYSPPVELPERMVVGTRFEISPLLPALHDGGPFYILAISGDGWRLLQCTRHSSVRVDLPGAPASLEEAMAVSEPTPSLQGHTADRPAGARTRMFHGHGVGSDGRAEEITEYLRQVQRAAGRLLRPTGRPLVIAATRERAAMLHDIAGYGEMAPEPIEGVPDHTPDEELRARGWDIVADRYDAELKRRISRYHDLRETDRVTTRIEAAIPAAACGRVDTVFAAADRPIWGTMPTPCDLERHDTRQPGDIDLVNEVVALTMLRGGSAYIRPADELPARDDSAVNVMMRW
ncbi:MAG: hypothetical protein ACF8R7_09540 [Phycisphaerales bacterium JB039]